MNTRISVILAGALSAMAFPLAVTSAEKPKILERYRSLTEAVLPAKPSKVSGILFRMCPC